MCVGAPNWPNTCKVQHFKSCCRFCSRIINRRIFCDRKKFHHSTKHIRRNGPPTSPYKSMHGQYNSLWNCERYNQATAITRNEYALFLDLCPKTFKSFLISWKSRQKHLADYFTKHNKRVPPIYLQIDKPPL